MDPSAPPPLIGIFRFAARYESKWNRAFGRHNPSGESFRGGFIILQDVRKFPGCGKHRDCHGGVTRLSTNPATDATLPSLMREPSDGDQI